jgi:hypothetical protein
MGKEATAKVTFTLENADEVLDLLRQLKSFVSNNNGAGGNAGMSGAAPAPGTASGSGTAAPPVGAAPVNPVTANPGANAAVMPQNVPTIATAGNSGGMFGTWNGSGFSSLTYDPMAGHFYDPSNGTYMIGGGGFPMGGGGGGRAAKPPAPTPAPSNIFSDMVGAGMVSQGFSIATQAAGMASAANANGQAFYGERLTPGGLALAGAGIGFFAGGPIGAGIGAGIGAIGGAIAGPQFERNIAEEELRKLAQATGYIGGWKADPRLNLNQDLLDRATAGLVSGQALAPGTYEHLQTRYGESPLIRGLVGDALQSSSYKANNLRRRGDPEAIDVLKDRAMINVIEGGSYGDEFRSARAIAALGNKYEADIVRGRGIERIIAEDDDRALGPEMGAAEFGFSRGAKYGGSAGARRNAGAYLAATDAQVANMRKRAGLARAGGDDTGARALEAQAGVMETSARDTVADTIYGAGLEEIGARAALAGGRADRGFESALYGGQSARDLPFEGRSKALSNQASELSRIMAERGDRLSPAERNRMMEQIESLNYRATTGIGREREGMINSESISRTGLGNAQTMSGEMPGILRGSAVDSTRQFELQAEALGKVRATYEQILSTSRYLTNEQKLQYQTQIEQLKVDEDRAKVAGVYARSAAVRSTAETGNIEASVNPSIALIRGAGGAAGSAAQAELLGLTDSNIAANEAELSANIAGGMSADSPQNQAIRSRLSSMRMQREGQQRSLAVSPMSAGDRASRSNLSTEAAFYGAGYGSFGDIRGNLAAQIGMSQKRIQELDENRSRIRGGKVKGTSWTDAMEADYTEARNSAALEALQLSEQYNYGYDQRLISQAYNMPGNGRLAMSRFTHREAAAAGVYHRAFGGSESQTRQMREMYPAMSRAMGSGRASNFGDRAMAGGAETKASVEVLIKVEDAGGRIRDNAISVTQRKTAEDINLNVQASKRPAG